MYSASWLMGFVQHKLIEQFGLDGFKNHRHCIFPWFFAVFLRVCKYASNDAL